MSKPHEIPSAAKLAADLVASLTARQVLVPAKLLADYERIRAAWLEVLATEKAERQDTGDNPDATDEIVRDVEAAEWRFRGALYEVFG